MLLTKSDTKCRSGAAGQAASLADMDRCCFGWEFFIEDPFRPKTSLIHVIQICCLMCWVTPAFCDCGLDQQLQFLPTVTLALRVLCKILASTVLCISTWIRNLTSSSLVLQFTSGFLFVPIHLPSQLASHLPTNIYICSPLPNDQILTKAPVHPLPAFTDQNEKNECWKNTFKQHLRKVSVVDTRDCRW